MLQISHNFLGALGLLACLPDARQKGQKHNQNMTVGAMKMAEKKTAPHLSYRTALLRQSAFC